MNIVYADQVSYNEIYQQKSIKMSFLNKKEDDSYRQMFYRVDCRDFLSDVLYAEQLQETVSQYNFTYTPSEQQIDRDKTRLLLQFKNEVDKKLFLDNICILHEIEQKNRLVRTKAIPVPDKNELIVEGSTFWLKATFSLHLYTYLLKVICFEYEDTLSWQYEIMTFDSNESYYMRQITPKKFSLLVNNLRMIFKAHSTVHGYREPTLNLIHNSGGVQTIGTVGKYSPPQVKENTYVKRFLRILQNEI